jgi:hypothetical protein
MLKEIGTTIASVPFSYRIALFLFLIGAVTLLDIIRHGQSSSRWKEALFILTVGMCGAVYGLLHDLVTSSISPEYFSMGKGLGDSPGLQQRALSLGAQAGFAAGAIASCFCLYFNRPRSGVPVIGYKHLAWPAVLCLVSSVTGAVVLGVTGKMVIPHATLEFARPSLNPVQFDQFRTVWAIHVGSYLGLIAGVVFGGVGIRRARMSGREAKTA